MARIPRLLPLVAVAIGGVLVVNAVRGAPNLIGAATSFAEDIAAPKGAKSAVPAGASAISPSTAKAPAPVCAPTAAELAKEAGLSPAELQVLQSLGNRRGELDQREQGLDTQVQLIAAAEAKLDDRIKEMNGLKQNITDLIGQADKQQQAETDRLVTVYEKMKPKDAAARMALLDDSVRLPIAAKMKPAILAQILGFMTPDDAKSLTEKLAHRVNGAAAITSAQNALNPPATPAAPPPAATAQKTPPAAAGATAAATPAATPPAAKPVRTAKAKPRPKPKADAPAVAANDKAAAAAAGNTTAKPAAAPTAGAPPAAKPAGAGATPAAAPTAGKTG